jgi:hypothetical protein
LGGQTVSAISSPNQNYVVTIDGNQTAWFWLNAGAELAQAPLPADVTQTSAAVPSPGGFSLAVVSAGRSLVQIFTMLPNQPQLAASITFAQLGGTPKRIALSDDGAAVLYVVNDGAQDFVYAWRSGQSPELITGGADISSLAFAPASHSAVIADGGANMLYLVSEQGGVFVPVAIASSGSGLSQPVAADFSRDAQQVIVANAGSETVQSFGLNGTLLGSAACDCNPLFLRRMIGNAVFGITKYEGASIAMFDGDSNPPRVTPVSSIHDISKSVGDRTEPAATTANFVEAFTTATQPASGCAVPTQQKYFSTDSSSFTPYLWTDFIGDSVSSSDAVWAQLRSCQTFSATTCAGGGLTGSAILLTHPSASSSCFYSSGTLSLPNPLPFSNSAVFQVAVFVNPTNSTHNNNEVPTSGEPIFAIANGTIGISLTGTRALLSSGGLNQQYLNFSANFAMPESSTIAVAPSFSVNSGVANVVGGNPAYDCRFVQSPVTITVAAGQTQGPVSVPVSAGTVAGTCTFAASAMTVGSNPSIPVTGSVQLTNSLDSPYISQATLTAQGNPFTIQIVGWATRRTLSSITFTFTATSGTTNSSSAPITISVGSQAQTYYTGAGSAATGGSYLYNQPFTVSGGSSSNIQSVTITVNDGTNSSSAYTLNFP